MTAVGLPCSAANTASSNFGSSTASSSIQPRSPPVALEASVETDLATSSHVLPPVVTSARAWSAISFAAAFWASVGSSLPSSTCGATAMIQAWRSSGVVDSSTILASICSGVTVMPCLRREVGLDLGVDELLDDERGELFSGRCLLPERLDLLAGLRARQTPGRHRRLDPGMLLLEPPDLDLRLLGEVVAGDRLAADRRRGREVVAVVGHGGDADEDDDGGTTARPKPMFR